LVIRAMKTALIRVAPLTPQRGYPVSLHVDDGSADWVDRFEVEGHLPESLSPPDPPVLDGAVATPESIRRFLLSCDHESPKFEEIGRYLHALLADGAVGAAWQRLAADNPGQGEGSDGLRLLLDIQPGELRQLPWELMWCDRPLPLFADMRNPCARANRFRPGPFRTDDDCWPPLRVLVVVGSHPEDDPVDAAGELEELREAFSRICGLVDLDLMHRPSQRELRDRYLFLKPHVFHFIGHGTRTAAGAALEFARRDDEDGWVWDTTAIAADLQGWRPRLVVLNACRSVGTADLAPQDRTWQLSDAFAHLDVPAVVGMQGDIRGDAAAAFTRGFYGALTSDLPLDVALTQGRLAISQALGWRRRDTWLPSLRLSAPPERVLPRRYGVPHHLRHQIETNLAFAKVSRFVDRAAERRRLWRAFGVEPSDARGRAVLAVIGEPKVGKSELVRWCLGASALRGANVAYVDFGRGRSLEFLPALARIAEELESSAIHGPANAAALDPYLTELDRLLGTPPGGGRRYGQAFRAAAEDAIPRIFDAFLDALAAAAGDRSLVVGLDHVDSVADAHWAHYICPNLVGPILRQRRLQLIVVVEPSAVDRLFTREMRSVVERVEVLPYPRHHAIDILSQYARAHGFKRTDFEGIVAALAHGDDQPWNAQFSNTWTPLPA
jgi:hypothetical protein